VDLIHNPIQIYKHNIVLVGWDTTRNAEMEAKSSKSVSRKERRLGFNICHSPFIFRGNPFSFIWRHSIFQRGIYISIWNGIGIKAKKLYFLAYKKTTFSTLHMTGILAFVFWDVLILIPEKRHLLCAWIYLLLDRNWIKTLFLIIIEFSFHTFYCVRNISEWLKHNKRRDYEGFRLVFFYK
jgi:hypothetical protein